MPNIARCHRDRQPEELDDGAGAPGTPRVRRTSIPRRPARAAAAHDPSAIFPRYAIAMHLDQVVDARAAEHQHRVPVAALPQYSPDGRWWWNGQEWVPVPYKPAPQSWKRPAQRPTPGRPSAGWIVLGLLLILTSVCTTCMAAGTAGYLSADTVNGVLDRLGSDPSKVLDFAPPPGVAAIPAPATRSISQAHVASAAPDVRTIR